MDKSEKKESFGKKYGLILALIAMAIVYLFPTPVDLPTQGHRLIGILVFAVIIWMTEGVSYPVSAFVIVTFMAFALGMAPDPAKHGALLGTSKALQMGLVVRVLDYSLGTGSSGYVPVSGHDDHGS